MNNKCMNLKIRSKKGQPYCYCACKRSVIDFNDCKGCLSKEYKKVAKMTVKKPLNKVSKNNKVTKATSIPTKVKEVVWKRDRGCCIFCKKQVEVFWANSHFIKRSQLGKGIEENLFTACPECHHDFDDTPKRKYMLPNVKEYLKSKYDYWNEDILIYKKWGN